MGQPEFPSLGSEQWAVVCADVRTGIVVLPNGTTSRSEEEYFRVFDSRVAAEAFAFDVLRDHPDVECALHDHDGPAVVVIRDESFFKRLAAAPRLQRSRWARLWRWLFGGSGEVPK